MKIGYSKTYPIAHNGTWEKIWLEDDTLGALNEEEVRQRLYSLKKQVENFHYESKAAAEKQMGTHVVDKQDPKMTLTKVSDLIKEINWHKDAAILERDYKYIAKTDPDLDAAYNKKLKQLSQ